MCRVGAACSEFTRLAKRGEGVVPLSEVGLSNVVPQLEVPPKVGSSNCATVSFTGRAEDMFVLEADGWPIMDGCEVGGKLQCLVSLACPSKWPGWGCCPAHK